MSETADAGANRWLLLVSAMVSFFAVGMTFFAVPPLIGTLRAEFALSNLAIGFLAGAIAVPAVGLSLPLGAALDRWPPRAAGLVGLGGMLVGAALFAVAPGYGWLLAGRLAFGIGALLMNLLLARLLSAAFAGRELALAMGLFTATYPASMIVLFTLHPFISARLGWRGEMGLLAALVALAIPLHAVAAPRRLRGGARTARRGADHGRLPPGLIALGVAWMLYFAAFGATPTFGPEWAGGGATGLLATSLITWVALVGTPLAGAAIDRSGSPRLWCVAGLGVMAGTLGLMAAGTVSAVVAMVALGLAVAVVPPAVYSLPATLVPPERTGHAFGFITALSNLGALAGPAFAGAVRDATPAWAPVWGSLAVAALAGAAVASLARPPSAGRERPAPGSRPV